MERLDQQIPIFVYGTLKRGEVLERLWPVKPMKIATATTLGRLFDLGPYPALVEGDDVIEGELWYIAENELERTLQRLDDVEGYLPEGNNLYERRVIRCRNEAGQLIDAFAYCYARMDGLKGKSPIRSGASGCRRWTSNSSALAGRAKEVPS